MPWIRYCSGLQKFGQGSFLRNWDGCWWMAGWRKVVHVYKTLGRIFLISSQESRNTKTETKVRDWKTELVVDVYELRRIGKRGVYVEVPASISVRNVECIPMLSSVTANSESGIQFLTLEYVPVVFTWESAFLLVAAFMLSLSLSLKNSKH